MLYKSRSSIVLAQPLGSAVPCFRFHVPLSIEPSKAVFYCFPDCLPLVQHRFAKTWPIGGLKKIRTQQKNN